MIPNFSPERMFQFIHSPTMYEGAHLLYTFTNTVIIYIFANRLDEKWYYLVFIH